MTGAKIPDGTDTVIMQEQVECVDNMIHIGPGHQPGQNVRRAGEDLGIGEIPETSCAQSVSLWLKERSMTVTVTPYTGCWHA
jgi:hypothetical protein